jgi:hypothetical protein
MPFCAGNDRADAISGKAKQGFPKVGTRFWDKNAAKIRESQQPFVGEACLGIAEHAFFDCASLSATAGKPGPANDA